MLPEGWPAPWSLPEQMRLEGGFLGCKTWLILTPSSRRENDFGRRKDSPGFPPWPVSHWVACGSGILHSCLVSDTLLPLLHPGKERKNCLTFSSRCCPPPATPFLFPPQVIIFSVFSALFIYQFSLPKHTVPKKSWQEKKKIEMGGGGRELNNGIMLKARLWLLPHY